MHRLLIAIRSQTLTDALARELLSRFDVHCCNTGTDASILIEQLRPDALVIELRLPGLSGLSVLEGCTYQPPAILALTDYIDNDVVCRAEAAGVDTLVQTPCTAHRISEHLERIIGKIPTLDF